MIAIEQVPMWLKLDRGISHALAQTSSGWHYTACGTITPNGEASPERPKRICGKCRAVIKRISLKPSEERS